MALRYELARKYDAKIPQSQYRVFHEQKDFRYVPEPGLDDGDHRNAYQRRTDFLKFKQFEAVREWMEAEGWEIGFAHIPWQLYMKYVFQQYGEMMPTPLQLMNRKLLKEFMALETEHKAPQPRRNVHQLARLYKKVLKPV